MRSEEPARLKRNKRIALRGILIALALILSYIESFIPISSALPGVKIGLANIVTIYALEVLGFREALVISLLRILLTAILFGNPAVMIYSLSGALCSLITMSLIARFPAAGITGISVTGAIMHNAGQCLAAALLLRNANVFSYLPVLLIAGVIAGVITGAASGLVLTNAGGGQP